MTDYLSFDEPFVSYFDTLCGNRQHRLRYWESFELQAALNARLSELGDVLGQPESEDRTVTEYLIKDWIAALRTELERRQRAAAHLGDNFAAVHREARRYPPALIARIKAAYDLRDVAAHDLGMSKPLRYTISSPFRADRHPSFAVYADHFYDFGTGEYGDVIDWRMRVHGLFWWQAVESLAIEAGIPLQGDPRPANSDNRPIRKVIDR